LMQVSREIAAQGAHDSSLVRFVHKLYQAVLETETGMAVKDEAPDLTFVLRTLVRSIVVFIGRFNGRIALLIVIREFTSVCDMIWL